jgi:glycerol-3-phosphate dehydrogenase
MKRDLSLMAEQSFDIVIIGGGATGAFTAWDAALRGFRVALLEKGDFAHATSSASTKLVHGGLRYLKSLEFSLVRESLAERRILSQIAPHLVYPVPFLLPVYNGGWRGRLTLELGLTLYDALSFDRGFLDDPDKRMPGHQMISRHKALSLEPGLSDDGLDGGFIYWDGQMVAPERLAMEAVIGAVERGAVVANRAEVTGFSMEQGRIASATVTDLETDVAHTIRGRLFVNATGASADQMMTLATGDAPRTIVRSKGIHVVVPKLTESHALALQVGDRHLFVVPWRGHSLVGTTDTPYDGPLDRIVPTREDVLDLLGVVNQALPKSSLSVSDICHAYAGLRPLVENAGDQSTSTYAKSRKSEVLDHEAEDGVGGLISALGGKWTTSRHVAEQVVDLAERKLSVWVARSQTKWTPLPGGQTGRFAAFRDRARLRFDTIDARVIDDLAQNYGALMPDVMAMAEGAADFMAPLSDGIATPLAAVRYAVRQEMALHLDDVLMRRTGIGTLGRPPDAMIDRIADLMAQELNWDTKTRQAEIDRALLYFPSFN